MILAFAWVFFGASHPSALPFSVLHLLHNQQIPNELGRTCPKGNSQHPAHSNYQPQGSWQAVIIHPGDNRHFEKEVAALLPIWFLALEGTFIFIYLGGAYVRKKKRNKFLFFKALQNHMRKLQVSTASNCCCISFASTVEHHGVNLILPLEKNPSVLISEKGGGRKMTATGLPFNLSNRAGGRNEA